ncbi:MBL fold metallo-hydrolase [Streptomyces sp. NPDC092369]|uniref:MBL fold metallo-hydrolase n=1 Tax=Streptomyces sp. NPDC092369 TaxID=3366015 RepID=UPI0038196443
MSASQSLGYEIFISEPIPQAVKELVPNGDRRMFSPLSTTLIYGKNDAVLVDPPMTNDQTAAVGDWIEKSGKKLTHIFVTHGHGDHWFGAGPLVERFPGSKVVASAGTIALMKWHASADARAAIWDRAFPDQIPTTPVEAETVPNNRFQLEGHDLVIVEVGHSDTDDTTVLHIPDLSLVVAGDVIYNGVHQYLSESADGGRDLWRSAIDIVAALEARWIVSGHKDKALDDDASRVIAGTRTYLNTVEELLPAHDDALSFFNAMLERFPELLNPGALWSGAQTLYR